MAHLRDLFLSSRFAVTRINTHSLATRDFLHIHSFAQFAQFFLLANHTVHSWDFTDPPHGFSQLFPSRSTIILLILWQKPPWPSIKKLLGFTRDHSNSLVGLELAIWTKNNLQMGRGKQRMRTVQLLLLQILQKKEAEDSHQKDCR